jgi:hypothetical protein
LTDVGILAALGNRVIARYPMPSPAHERVIV